MKKLSGRTMRVLDITVITLAVSLVGVGLYNKLGSAKSDVVCETFGKNHQLTLKDGKFTSEKLDADKCDTVTVTNLDNTKYMLAFGNHDKHIDYLGFTEQVLRPNESAGIDLLQTGTFRLHDHYKDQAAIDITIRIQGE